MNGNDGFATTFGTGGKAYGIARQPTDGKFVAVGVTASGQNAVACFPD